MSFQTPSARQESQNRKILEELQQQKKLLMSNKQVSASSAQNSSGSSSQVVAQNQSGALENHAMSQSQRTALQHAHDNSVGYYITQDSTYGNLILPVLPRFDTNGIMIS